MSVFGPRVVFLLIHRGDDDEISRKSYEEIQKYKSYGHPEAKYITTMYMNEEVKSWLKCNTRGIVLDTDTDIPCFILSNENSTVSHKISCLENIDPVIKRVLSLIKTMIN
jgi:hypothetical protein